MKRINLTIDNKLYEKARRASFITRRSISDLLREAMGEWFLNHSFSHKGELLLESSDEKEILEILESNDFVEMDDVKLELGISDKK